jgi:glutamine synthetase
MVRIPLGNEKSSRIEVRSVGPDANPHLLFYTILQTGFNGPMTETITSEQRRTRTRFLPSNIYDAIRLFKGSAFISEVLGEENKEKFIDRKAAAADRCPRELGTIVKTSEVLFHHEVTNQYLWSKF